MRHLHFGIMVLLMGVLVVGCKKEEKPASTTGEESTGTVSPTKAPTDAPTDATVNPQPGQPSETAIKDQVKEEAAKVEEAVKPVATAAADVPQAADAAAEQLAKDTQSELEKILAAIKDGKLTDAESMLAGLEAKVNTLPAPWPERIAEARKALDAAKLAESAKSLIPGNTRQ